jgi:hypothetical protein
LDCSDPQGNAFFPAQKGLSLCIGNLDGSLLEYPNYLFDILISTIVGNDGFKTLFQARVRCWNLALNPQTFDGFAAILI